MPADETAIGDILSNIPETSPETIPSHVQFLSQETKGVAGRANRQSPATGLDNDGWLQFPLSDPAIKFTVSPPPNTPPTSTDSPLLDPQTHNPTHRPPSPRLRRLLCSHSRRPPCRPPHAREAEETRPFPGNPRVAGGESERDGADIAADVD